MFVNDICNQDLDVLHTRMLLKYRIQNKEFHHMKTVLD